MDYEKKIVFIVIMVFEYVVIILECIVKCEENYGNLCFENVFMYF